MMTKNKDSQLIINLPNQDAIDDFIGWFIDGGGEQSLHATTEQEGYRLYFNIENDNELSFDMETLDDDDTEDD